MTTNCKNCNHESWCHQDSFGPCHASIIISASAFYEVEVAPGLKGVTQDVEYGDDCDCLEFTTTKKKVKRKNYFMNMDTFLS